LTVQDETGESGRSLRRRTGEQRRHERQQLPRGGDPQRRPQADPAAQHAPTSAPIGMTPHTANRFVAMARPSIRLTVCPVHIRTKWRCRQRVGGEA